jgi:acyl carrier protein phosphodiesterase
MNWLAHLVLSEPAPAFRVGNILADILPIGEIRELPEPFQLGVARHRAIDAFTDSHPIFKRSVARLEPPFRRFGGVIMDVFYDHALTRSWDRYCGAPVGEFVAGFHLDVEACRRQIPAGAYAILVRMRTGAWLTSYGDLDGVRTTLGRISKRLRRPFDLSAAADVIELNYDALVEDFEAFFPDVISRFSSNNGSDLAGESAGHQQLS